MYNIMQEWYNYINDNMHIQADLIGKSYFLSTLPAMFQLFRLSFHSFLWLFFFFQFLKKYFDPICHAFYPISSNFPNFDFSSLFQPLSFPASCFSAQLYLTLQYFRQLSLILLNFHSSQSNSLLTNNTWNSVRAHEGTRPSWRGISQFWLSKSITRLTRKLANAWTSTLSGTGKFSNYSYSNQHKYKNDNFCSIFLTPLFRCFCLFPLILKQIT